MSDGPHRSLPMRQAWKQLAEAADNPATSTEERIQLLRCALEADLREEIPNQLLRQVRTLVGDQQSDLWDIDLFENLRSEEAAGFPLSMVFIDSIIRISTDEFDGETVLKKAICAALSDRFVCCVRQIEEHYLRKSYPAKYIINRIKDAHGKSLEMEIASTRLSGMKRSQSSTKRTGIDEGIRIS